MNPCAGITDLLVFEARPFSLLGTPPSQQPPIDSAHILAKRNPYVKNFKNIIVFGVSVHCAVGVATGFRLCYNKKRPGREKSIMIIKKENEYD